MPTATKSKTSLASQMSELAEEAERLIVKLADDEELTADEYVLLSMAGFDSKTKLSAEVRRLRNIRRFQDEAGTAQDRERVKQEIADGREKLAKRGPEIDKQIEELQRQKRAMEAQIEGGERDLESMHRSLKSLQDISLLPSHVYHRYLAASRFVREQFEDVAAAESELRYCNDVQAMREKQLDEHITTLGQGFKCPSPTAREVKKGRTLDESARKAFLAEIAERKRGAEATLKARKPLRDKARTEAEALKNYYVK